MKWDVIFLPIEKPDRKTIAELADSLLLRLDEEQLNLMEREFASIVAQFERLLAIDTSNVEPTDFAGLQSVRSMRIDAISERPFTRGDMMKNTASLTPSGLLAISTTKA